MLSLKSRTKSEWQGTRWCTKIKTKTMTFLLKSMRAQKFKNAKIREPKKFNKFKINNNLDPLLPLPNWNISKNNTLFRIKVTRDKNQGNKKSWRNYWNPLSWDSSVMTIIRNWWNRARRKVLQAHIQPLNKTIGSLKNTITTKERLKLWVQFRGKDNKHLASTTKLWVKLDPKTYKTSLAWTIQTQVAQW